MASPTRIIRRRVSQEDQRNNNNVLCPESSVDEDDFLESLGSLPLTDGYVEDNHLELTLLQQEYQDPSIGYEFVNGDTGWPSHLDNSEALLRQLSELGIRVSTDYITLDFDATTASRTASLSTVSEDDDSWRDAEAELDDNCRRGTSERHLSFDWGSLPPSLVTGEEPEDEVVRAEILPSGGVKVSYDNLQKVYSARISPEKNYRNFLSIVQNQEDERSPSSPERVSPSPPSPKGGGGGEVVVAASPFMKDIALLKKKLTLSLGQLRRLPLTAIQAKCAARIRKLKADEMTYDAMTPDSGVHENFATLTPEEQEKQREEWKVDLSKTEEEIQTLRHVLSSKVKHAQDLKRRLGITVWREFSDDITSSFRSVKESQPVVKANEAFTEFHSAVTSAPLYQKTAGAIGAVSEKTGAIFGGIGAKFGQLKETPTFKSFEERVGSVYTTAKSKMTGSESNSTQDFEEALREAEAEKAAADAANAASNGAVTTDPASVVPGQTAAS